MEIQERIQKLMEVEAFRDAFAAVTNPQEVVDLFGANGIEVPYEIAEELFQPVSGEELSADTLDDVAGGGAVGALAGGVVFYGAGYLGGRLAGWNQSKSHKYATSCSYFGAAFGGMISGLM